MAIDLDPVARLRRRRARDALDILLLTALAVRLCLLVAPAVAGHAGPSAPHARLRIDVSGDEAERLTLLPEIGPGRAAAILEDRKKHGPLPSLKALDRVPGIGPTTVERILSSHGVDPVASGSATERTPRRQEAKIRP